MNNDIEIQITKLTEYQNEHERLCIEFNRNKRNYNRLKRKMESIRYSCSKYIELHSPGIFIDFDNISDFYENINDIIGQLKSK